MKRLWKSRFLRGLFPWGLSLALGVTASVQGGDVEWRAAGSQPGPSGVSLERPRAMTGENPLGKSPIIIRAQMTDTKPGGNGREMLPLPKGASPSGMEKGTGGFPNVPVPKPISDGGGAKPGPSHFQGSVSGQGLTVVPDGALVDGGFGADGPCVSGPMSVAPCRPGRADCCGLFGRLWNRDACCTEYNPRFWLGAEYLMWWIKGNRIPPLVTTDSPANTLSGNPNLPLSGSLGSGSTVLFGGGYVDNDTRSGARFRSGYWFDDDHCLGVDGSFFFLGQRGVNFMAGSDGNPAYFRPFFNQNLNIPDAEIVSFPDPFNTVGSVMVSWTSRVWGGETNLRTNLVRDCWCNLDLLGGFRYFGLDEKLEIMENVTQRFGDPANFLVNDRFQTRNRFYGGQMGLEAELRRGRWFLDLRGKVALGNVHQTVTITGATAATPLPNGPTTVMPGGLLALPSNIGKYSRDRFAVLPEVGVKLGYQVTDHLRAFAGYDFMYLSSVVRPGEQIDLVVNTSGVPRFGGGAGGAGPGARPQFHFKDSDFWLHGLSFGLEFRY